MQLNSKHMIYWSYGCTEGYPESNTSLPAEPITRLELENYLSMLLRHAIATHSSEGSVWFVIDEVSKMLNRLATDGSSYYQSLRREIKTCRTEHMKKATD